LGNNYFLYYGGMHPVAHTIKVVSKPSSQRLLKMFYSYLIATCFGLSDGHLQATCKNYSKKLLYLQWIRCVLVQILIMHVSCRQLLSLSFICIKFKYFKIILLKYLNIKMVAEIIKII
jgi:hypothetical protein